MQEFHQFLGKSTPNQGGNEPSPPDILGEYLNRSRAVLNESKVPREQFGHSSTSYVAVSGLFPAASVSSIITTAASCRRPELSTGAGLHLLKVTAPELQGFPSDYFAGVSQVQGDYDSTVYAVLRSQAAESSATSAVERLLQGRTEQRIDRLLTTTNEPTTISPALLSVIQQVTEEESRLKSDPQRLAALNQQQHNNSLPPLPQLNSLVSSIGLTNDNPAATLDAHADPIISRMGRSGRQSISSFDDSHSLEDIGANDESPEDIYGRVIKDYANGANEILKPNGNGRKRRRSSSTNSGFGDGSATIGRLQHSCEHCGKSFQNNSALIKHKLIHSDERKFICHQCSKGFKRLDHLNGHLNVHKSVKPFQCVIVGCDKSYCDARSLRRHLEHAHNMHNPVVHSSRGIINVRCDGVNYSRAMNSTNHSSAGESLRRPTSQSSSASADSTANSIRSQNPNTAAAADRISGAESSEADASPSDQLKKKPVKDLMKPKHQPPVQPVTCGQCNRMFKNVPALNGHMRLHSQMKKVKPDSSGNGSSPHFSSPAGSCASASDSRVLSPAAAGGSTAVMNNFCPSVTNDLNPEQMEYGSYMGAGGNSADHSNIMNPLPIARAVANYEFPPTSLENDLINSFTGCYSPAPVAQHSHHMSAPEPLTIEPLEHTNVMAGVQDPMIHSAPASFVYYTEPSNFNSDPFALEGFVDKQRYTMADGRCTMQDQQHQHNSDALQQSLFVETYQDADVKCQMNEQMQNHTAINNSHYSNQNNLAVVPYDTGVNSFPYTITTNGTDVHVDPVLHSGNRNLLLSAEPVNGGIVSNQMLQGGDVHPNCMPMGHDHVNNAGQMLSGLGNLIEQQQTHMACGQQNLVDPMVDLHHYTNLSSTAGANQPGSFEPTGSLFTDLDETIMNTTADLVGEYHTNAGMNDFDDPELASLFSLSYGGFEPPQACAAGTSSQYYQYGSNFVDQNSEKNEALRKRHFTAPGAISMSKFPTSGKPMKPLSPKGRKRHKQSGNSGTGTGNNQSRPTCSRDVRRSQQQFVEKKFFNLPVSPVRFKKRTNRPTPLLLPGAATLNRFCSQLRSPKCWEYPSGSKIPPYTPPPILSPMRFGSGLFWKLSRLAHYYLTGPRSAPIAQKFSYPFSPTSPNSQAPRKDKSLLPSSDKELLEIPTADIEEPIETAARPHINIGEEFQAVIPDFAGNCRYEDNSDTGDLCVFQPSALHHLSEDSIKNYLDFACTAAVYGGGRNLELALNVLYFCHGDVQEAVSKLVELHVSKDAQQLVPYGYVDTEIWTQEEIVRFSGTLQKFDKDFYAVAHEIPSKNVKMCVSFYYFWKKVCFDEYKRLRTIRKKRELTEQMGAYNLRSSNSAVTIVTEELPEATAELSQMHLSTIGRDFTQMTQTSNGRSSGDKGRVTFNEILQTDYPCKVCGKVFEKTKSRNAHMRSHSTKVQ